MSDKKKFSFTLADGERHSISMKAIEHRKRLEKEMANKNYGQTQSGPFLAVCRGQPMYAVNDGTGQIKSLEELTEYEFFQVQAWCSDELRYDLLKIVDKEYLRRKDSILENQEKALIWSLRMKERFGYLVDEHGQVKE